MPATEPLTHCTHCGHALERDALFCPKCGTARSRASSGDPLIGSVIGDRFLLIERLGHGGSGTIYRAEHVTLRRKVAVKVLHHELSRDDLAVERFRREATTVSEIDNDHIVEIHDFGRTADGRLYLAMELLEGQTLQQVIERERRLGIERSLDVLLQLGEALSEAHAMGYVHRDLRPRNLWLSNRRGREDFVKLLDFGLAKLVEHEGLAASTSLGMTFGDPKYMSPEQARGEALDRRADIYSMGCIAYEMLIGAPPFADGKVFDILTKHIDTDPIAPGELRGDVPEWLSDVIMRMLAKKPEDRFMTVMVLVEALRQRTVDPVPVPSLAPVPAPNRRDEDDPRGQRARTSTALYGEEPEPGSRPADSTDGASSAAADPRLISSPSSPRAPARKTQPGLPPSPAASGSRLPAVDAGPDDSERAAVPPGAAAGPEPAATPPGAAAQERASSHPSVPEAAGSAASGGAAVTPVAMARPVPAPPPSAPDGSAASASSSVVGRAARAPTPVPFAAQREDSGADASTGLGGARGAPLERAPGATERGVTPAPGAQSGDEVRIATGRRESPGDPPGRSDGAHSGAADDASEASISASLTASRAAASSSSMAASSSPSLSNSGISGDWFADAEGDLDEHGQARLEQARAFIDADDTTLVNDAALFYEPRRDRRKIAAAVGGALLIIVLAIVLWPSGEEVTSAESTAHDGGAVGAVAEPAAPSSNAAAVLAAMNATADAGVAAAVASDAGVAAGGATADTGTDPTAADEAPPEPASASADSNAAGGADRAQRPRRTEAADQRRSERRAARAARRAAKPAAAAAEPKPDAPTSEGAKQAVFFSQMGQQSLRNGSILEAARHFKKALELDPKNADAIMGQGEIAYRQGAYGNAIRHYAKAAGMRPRSARAHTLLGEAYLGSGDNGKAAKSFKRALSLRPGDARAQRGYTEATGQPPPG